MKNNQSYLLGKYREGSTREKLFKALIQGTTRENLFKIAGGEITTATSFLSAVQRVIPAGRSALLMYRGKRIFIAEFSYTPLTYGLPKRVIIIPKSERHNYRAKKEKLTDKKKQWKGK